MIGDAQKENEDLIWDLDDFGKQQLAKQFAMLFENRLCVYSESVEQLYTNYSMNFPSNQNSKMVVLPNPYAYHDTISHINFDAIKPTGIVVLPGELVGRSGLHVTILVKNKHVANKPIPFKKAIAHVVGTHKKAGDTFLPVLVKGDLREFNQTLPYMHLHRIKPEFLAMLSEFDRSDIERVVSDKLKKLYIDSDRVALNAAH
ncbi:hypothetical protein [Litoribacillus peritrichatus]|uniref:Uncharacterized protein n=1 Tax=Litoribacillus peritrichatus TaxID=718191 RepID=A0ABP7MJI2_9GAMM